MKHKSVRDAFALPKAAGASFKDDSCFWRGAIPFEDSLKAQEKLKDSAGKSKICFFGFESLSPVISLGLRSDKNHVLWPEKKLKQYKISQIRIRRGGEATLHAPGQLVIYPVAHLPALGFKVRDWIRALENITKVFLEGLGLKTRREGKYAGLYTKNGKIAFFGIHISGGVSQHGLSINVSNDLSLFKSIRSCGEAERTHDKLSFYPGFSLSLQELFFLWCRTALDFFELECPSNRGS